MGRLVKCQMCSELVDKDCAVRVDNKNFHKDCAIQYSERKELYAYICYIFKLKAPGPININQIKNFMIKYPHYTYKGIQNTLEYYFEVEGGSIPKARERIGIVPYVYDRAQEYFKKIDIKKEKIEKVYEKQLNDEKIIVKRKKETFQKEKKLYNLEEL